MRMGSFQRIWTWLILGLLTPFLLAFGAAETTSGGRDYYVLHTRGAPADAVVTAVLFRQHNNPTAPATQLAVRFPTPAGTVDEYLDVVGTTAQNAAVGDHLAVIYDPRDPATVRLHAALLPSDFWWALAFLVGGLAIAVIGVTRIAVAVRRRLRRPAPVPG